ncbi:MAG: CDP-alcohol phosphatidyltransferase family protein [Thermodesulfobacteriota bacterium]|nr:MAG: CDP-alcohol phosphatidyltransferase family protein [Thermodesulfobacteriota bacterium]
MTKPTLTETVKSLSQPLILPIVKFLARLNVHPNIISILGLLGFVISSYFIAIGKFFTAGLFIAIFGPLDAIDGALARFSNKVTSFGGFLDSTLDRYAEIFIFLASIYYFLNQGSKSGVILSFLAITGSLMVSYTRARAEGAGFECKIGLLTRFERILLLIISLFLNIYFFFLIFISIFSHFTALQRIFYIYSQYKKRKK